METTLNIHIDIMEKISCVSESRGISCSAMIITLLQKILRDKKNRGRMGRLVQYQKRCGREYWHPFHITWRADEYEYFLDMRKILKMSVSLILKYAVEKYLMKLKKKDFTDKNRFRNYFIVGKMIDNVICWRIFWGCPRNLKRHLRTWIN